MEKSPDAFRTISEVAEDLDLPQHVLRFWETRFPQIKPLKRGGGRRYYRPGDIDLLKGIRQLLYGDGYTIKGVQRILKSEGVRFVEAIGRGEKTVAPAAVAAADDDIDTADGADGASAPGPIELAGDETGADGATLDSLSFNQLRAALAELKECRRVLSLLRETGDSGEDFGRSA